MKRGKKLLILLAVLVLLSAAAFGATRLFAEDDGEETDTVAFTLAKDTISEIQWQYLSQGSDFVKNGDSWEYVKDRAFPLNSDYINDMLNTVVEISASKTITEPEALSQYGLDAPHCSVTLTADGGEYTLNFGDETSIDELQYFSWSREDGTGDGNVYLVDAGLQEAFNYGLYDLVKKDSVPTMTDLVSLTGDTVDGSYELDYLEDSGLAYSDDYVWFLKEGDSYRALDTDLASTFVSTIRYLTWGDCADYCADEDELESYGFSDPTAVITLNYLTSEQVDTGMTASDGGAIYDTKQNANSFVLEIGKAYNDSAYYARVAGSDIVCFLTVATVDTLLHTTYADLAPDEVLVMDWANVSDVEITLGDAVYTFVRTGETDDNGDIWTLDGNTVDFQAVADELDSMYFSGYASGLTTDGQDEQISFVIHQDNENFPEVTLRFCRYDNSDCITELNGSPTVLVSSTSVQSLKSVVNSVLE